VTERWDRLTELFHAALALPEESRARFLDAECAGDTTLRSEVERLVRSSERAGRFIETPAVEAARTWATETDDASANVGRRIGDYRIVREIAHGGMGAVYLAERADGQFEQRVAIKLIKRGMDTDLILRRFRAERQILASLEHPNVARLLDGGSTEDGLPYFVMEYIEGQPIDEYAEGGGLGITERLELFVQVCAAVDHAHKRHIVHRDIKPANILVTASGTPKLLDFGIARLRDPDGVDSTTLSGLRLLTPEYASPEQVQGGQATAVSDVYSLGVVLYELLTGRSPYRFRSRDPNDVAEAIRTADPERPSTAVGRDGELRAGLRRRLRGDLDVIVLMALRKDPARRYQSPDELANDIRRHLARLPVLARPDSVVYRARKFIARNRSAVIAGTAVGAVALLTGAGVVSYRARGGTPSSEPGVLAPRDRILVADVADRAGDPALAAAVSEALRVELAQSPFVRVLSARQVRSALARMERPPDLAIDDSIAREIAVRQGVKALVTGSVTRVAGRYTFTAQLVGAEKGDLLAALRETATDSSDIIETVDRLGGGLRRKMGESLRSIESSQRLAEVTTQSLEALRAYTSAVRLIATGDRLGGIRLLERAVSLDTGFAFAYRVLANTYGDMVEMGRATEAAEHAIANQQRLPYYERYHLIANYSYGMLRDYPRAIEAYHRILERYPDDVIALNNLGYVHALRREYAVQESLSARARAADSTIPSIVTGMAMAQINQGKFAAARRTFDELKVRVPGFFNAELGEIYLAAGQQDWTAAERLARARLVAHAADSMDAMDGYETLAGIVITLGRLAEGERHSRRVMALSERLASPGRHLSSAMRVAWMELRFRNDTARALDVLTKALGRFPLDSIAFGDRPYDDLARVFAAAGQPARARELVAQAEQSPIDQRRIHKPYRIWARGAIALAEGRKSEALAQIRAANAGSECPICVLPDLARAYDAAAQPDSAIAIYESYIATPFEWRFETDYVELGWGLKRLGELYAQRGDQKRAADAYGRLLTLWKGADKELAPVIAEVRRRTAM
jgi:tetratricopeptide (TPR) repeat protein/tRNA A-37 threonylcarbamoyl transferase component Bud32